MGTPEAGLLSLTVKGSRKSVGSSQSPEFLPLLSVAFSTMSSSVLAPEMSRSYFNDADDSLCAGLLRSAEPSRREKAQKPQEPDFPVRLCFAPFVPLCG